MHHPRGRAQTFARQGQAQGFVIVRSSRPIEDMTHLVRQQQRFALERLDDAWIYGRGVGHAGLVFPNGESGATARMAFPVTNPALVSNRYGFLPGREVEQTTR
jgi:hypothetical protein